MSDPTDPDALPPDLAEALIRLWRLEQPIVVTIRPRDAWTICAIVQVATRNPALTPTHHRLIESFGRELQRALCALDPVLDTYLELGWDPAHDQPRSDR